jgi:hypothetical protein
MHYRIPAALLFVTIFALVPLSAAAGWDENGILLGAPASNAYKIRVLPDGSGGAYIVWCDDRNSQDDPNAALDGGDGILLVWRDGRSGAYNDIYGQKIDSDADLIWAGGGFRVNLTVPTPFSGSSRSPSRSSRASSCSS